MDYKQMTAPCGLDCFNCPAYLAKDNEKLRGIISKKMGVPLEKAFCQGCRNENGKIADEQAKKHDKVMNELKEGEEKR